MKPSDVFTVLVLVCGRFDFVRSTFFFFALLSLGLLMFRKVTEPGVSSGG